MSWFTKEDKIPDLPDSDELPRLPELQKPKDVDAFEPSFSNSLPALPEPMSNSKQLPLEMQRSRFDIKPNQSPIIPEQKEKIQPMFEPSFSKVEPKITSSMAPSKFEQKKSKASEPIYVRLDKFQETQDSIREIREKIEDIEKNLSKIKDIKDREEIELNEWEREAQLIKQKLSAIDANLFSNI